MGAAKKLKEAISKPIDGIKDFILHTMVKLLMKTVHVIKVKIGQPIMKVMNSITKVLMIFKKWFMNVLHKIVGFFKLVYFYIKCGVKLLTNFHKCAIFYFLDIFKYLFFYLPLLIIMGIMGLGKEWLEIQKKLDTFLAWPNSVQNDCYRCKTIKAKTMDWNTLLKKFLASLEGKNGSFNFFMFLLIVGIILGFSFTFWHIWLRKNGLSSTESLSIIVPRPT